MDTETTSDVILEGAVGIYRRIKLEECGEDSSCLVSFDSDLGSLGFTLAGDLICSALARAMIRGYLNPVERSSVLLLTEVKDRKLNVLGMFFEAMFADGASLTTTTSRAVKDKPPKKYGRVHAWKGVYDLHARHQEHVSELKTKHGDLQPVGDTLLSFAQALDSANTRQ